MMRGAGGRGLKIWYHGRHGCHPRNEGSATDVQILDDLVLPETPGDSEH